MKTLTMSGLFIATALILSSQVHAGLLQLAHSTDEQNRALTANESAVTVKTDKSVWDEELYTQ